MNAKANGKYKILLSLIAGLAAALLFAMFITSGSLAHAQSIPTPVVNNTQTSQYLTVKTLTTANGISLTDTIIHGPPVPPAGFSARPSVTVTPATATTLTTPAYTWLYGCSAVSASMIAGYYDNHGYPNMYTGPTNGGVMPLTDASWSHWTDSNGDDYPNNPLVASHNGVDGRTVKGSIDDYWSYYGSSDSDPYIIGSWTQHTWGSAIGDYMKTSQSSYGNTDGSTQFYTWTTSAAPLTCSDMAANAIDTIDGTYGRKLFYQAKGYTVTDCYNQKTDNNGGGFTFANFQAQINAGHPVLLNLAGHSIVGVGYDTASNTVYVHDTWDTSTHTMTWGGSYASMELLSVSVVNLATTTIPTPIAPSGTITDTTPTFTWSKVSGATQYRFAVYQGTSITPKYTKIVASSACGATNCSNTPTTVLSLGAYKWKVQAYVSSAWKSYSSVKNFTVSAIPKGFNSQFNGDATGWMPVYGAWKIQSSNYYATAGITNLFASTKYANNYSTLTYQARMKRNGCTSCANYLIVRGTPSPLQSPYKTWYEDLRFQYTSDGSYSIWQEHLGSYIMIKDFTSTAAIHQNDWNTLKVVANGSAMKFYINGTLVWSGNISTSASGQVGIGMYNSGAVGEQLLVDWATLSPTFSSSLDDGMLDLQPVQGLPVLDNGGMHNP